MNKNIENIDGLVKESLKDFKVEVPSDEGWKKLSRQLIWINFLRFSPYRFNIYYLSSLTIAGILAAFLFSKSVEQAKEKTITPLQIIKHNEAQSNNAANNNLKAKISSPIEKNVNAKNITTHTQYTKNYSNSTTRKLSNENTSSVSTTKLVRDTIVIRKKIVVRDTVKVLMPQKDK